MHSSTNSLVDYTEQFIAKLSGVLNSFRQQSPNAELLSLLSRWEQQISQMRQYAQTHSHVSIAFVGGTGAGKSTLLNALLGVDLLPTHSFRTCTSAAIEVAHAARKTWRARLLFLPLQAWEDEKALFLEEVQASTRSGHSTFTYQDFLYKAWSMYRPRKGQPPMPFPLEHLLELLKEPLPAGLLSILEQGEMELKARSPAELKAQLEQYLTAESPAWPLIQEVRIEGPLPILQDGLHLIDLPGLNDPNPVREAIARKYLQQAEFLWLIFGTGRGLTREVVELMKDQHFMSQIILDGKVSALSFVGTRADDFVPELERRTLQMAPEASAQEIYQAREMLIKQQIQQQLSELTLWFGNRYKVSEQSQAVLNLIASTLQESPIYLTSALAYLSLQGWFPLPQSLFSSAEQTGVPALQAYMQSIVAEHGIKARKKLIRSQGQQMNSEILRLLSSLKHRRQLTGQERQQLSALQVQLTHLHQRQLQNVENTRQELQQALKLKQIQFEKQLLYAFTDLQRRLDILLEPWQELNWQYLARAVKQGGRYHSAGTGLQVDLLRDIVLFIESEVALDWYAFFQHHLLKELDQSRSLNAALLEQSLQELSETVKLALPSQLPRLQELSAQSQEIMDQSAYRLRKQAEQAVRELQKQMTELLESSVQQAMQPIFDKAAAGSGTGLKQYILDTLSTGLHQQLTGLGQEIQATLSQRLQILTGIIVACHETLAQELTRALETLSQLQGESSK